MLYIRRYQGKDGLNKAFKPFWIFFFRPKIQNHFRNKPNKFVFKNIYWLEGGVAQVYNVTTESTLSSNWHYCLCQYDFDHPSIHTSNDYQLQGHGETIIKVMKPISAKGIIMKWKLQTGYIPQKNMFKQAVMKSKVFTSLGHQKLILLMTLGLRQTVSHPYKM